MKRNLLALVVLLLAAAWGQAKGLLIPEDKKVPPLAMLNHKITVDIEDQVAITSVSTVRSALPGPIKKAREFPGLCSFVLALAQEDTIVGRQIDEEQVRDRICTGARDSPNRVDLRRSPEGSQNVNRVNLVGVPGTRRFCRNAHSAALTCEYGR